MTIGNLRTVRQGGIIQHFDVITKACLQHPSQHRFLIIDRCEIHVYIAFIKYCEEAKIMAYCLPPYSTHLVQPLDVGLFSPLQRYYGKQLDRLTCYGAVAINKGNFLPLLVRARTETYTKANILSAWRGVGLIPNNPRIVLSKQGP